MHFNIILDMNTWYKKMKRIVWVNPASFIKSRRDLMSGPFRRKNVNAFSRLILFVQVCHISLGSAKKNGLPVFTIQKWIL